MRITKAMLCVIVALFVVLMPLTVCATEPGDTSSSTPSTSEEDNNSSNSTESGNGESSSNESNSEGSSSNESNSNVSDGNGSEPIELPDSFSITIQCKINGEIPKDTKFIFSVTQSLLADSEETTNDSYSREFVIDTATDTSGEKTFTISKADNELLLSHAYTLKLKESSNSTATLDKSEIRIRILDDGTIEAFVNDEEHTDLSQAIVLNCTTLKQVTVTTKNMETLTKVYDGKTDFDIKKIPLNNIVLEGIDEADKSGITLEFTEARLNSADVKKATKVIVSGLKLKGQNADKYAFANDSFECTATVTPRPLTVTAKSTVIEVGKPLPKLTFTLSEEVIDGNNFKCELKCNADVNTVGTYDIVSDSCSAGDNYTVTFVPGKLTVSSFKFTTAVDSATSVKVSGYFDAGATVKVTALDGQSEVYSKLASQTTWGTIISAYEVSLSTVADGNYTLEIPVDSKYEGKSVKVYQPLSNGDISCYITTVENGYVTITTAELSQFMLAGDKQVTSEEEETSVFMTILKVFLIILAIILGLAVVIALFFFGMVFFNKTEELKAIIRFIRRLLKK